MTARWWAFGLWALVAASAVYWGLRLFVPGQPAPAQATVAGPAAAPRGDLTRLFGIDAGPVVAEEAPPAPTSSRFQLVGVVAPRGASVSDQGVALIAVDGKPPRAYKVGAVVDGDTVLQSVRQRGASLGPRGADAQVSLEIPPQPPPATGQLPGIGMAPPAGMVPPPPPQSPPPPLARPTQALPALQGQITRSPGAAPPYVGQPPRAMEPPPVGRPEGMQTE